MTSSTVTYCYFPDFESQVPAWSSIATAQLRFMPPSVTREHFVVRQRLTASVMDPNIHQLPLRRWRNADVRAGTPHSVPVSTRWAAPGEDSFAQTQVLAFSIAFAMRAVTGVSPTDLRQDGSPRALCGGPGALTFFLEQP